MPTGEYPPISPPPPRVSARSSETSPSIRRTRTLYVREEDQAVWDQAKEIIGDSLSTHITDHLRRVVERKKVSQYGFERIVIRFTDGNIPQAKAFYGHWIIPPQNPFCPSDRDFQDSYAVAITPKKKVVVFNFWEGSYSALNYLPGTLAIFDCLDEIGKDGSGMPEDLLGEVMKKQGIEIQELDI